MKQNFIKNKVNAIVLALAVAIGIFLITSVTTVSAATDKVSMYSSGRTFTRQGISTYEVFIRTTDNAISQKVSVHYLYMPTLGWCDAQAEYVTTLEDGSKIWKADFTSYNGQYVIRYDADGETIWDNNNGNDYHGVKVIGTAPVSAERMSCLRSMRNYQINAVLQNYAYDKNVFVRYTTDGWNTYADQSLYYSNTNNDGTETWTTILSLESLQNSEDFEYAICYQVNGNTYWANYFGENYNFNYSIHY